MKFETIVRAWAVLGVILFSAFILSLAPETSSLVEIIVVIGLYAGVVLSMASAAQLILMLIKPKKIEPVNTPHTSTEPETTQKEISKE